jgi:hypothetical protein
MWLSPIEIMFLLWCGGRRVRFVIWPGIADEGEPAPHQNLPLRSGERSMTEMHHEKGSEHQNETRSNTPNSCAALILPCAPPCLCEDEGEGRQEDHPQEMQSPAASNEFVTKHQNQEYRRQTEGPSEEFPHCLHGL